MTVTTDASPEIDDPNPRRAYSVIHLLMVALMVAVVSVAVTAWWTNREAKPSAVDIGFYDDMTSHHAQAVVLSQIYLQHGTDPVMRNIASEIVLGQAGEMKVMQFALRDWNAKPDAEVAMEWMGMSFPQNAQPGMATDEQIAALDQARGKELDDQFSRLMIDHHLGGIHMAENAQELGHLDEVTKFAGQMVSSQQFEIDDLNRQRVRLGLAEYDGA